MGRCLTLYSDKMAANDAVNVKSVVSAVMFFMSHQEKISDFFKIIDKLCTFWLGKRRNDISLNNSLISALARELCSVYLSYQTDTERIALWLIALNRCCHISSKPSSVINNTQGTLSANPQKRPDHMFIEDVLQKARGYEENHHRATVERLGEDDPLDAFYQWVGIYCMHIYPNTDLGNTPSGEAFQNAISYLLEEYERLDKPANVTAFFLLSIKEACALDDERVSHS